MAFLNQIHYDKDSVFSAQQVPTLWIQGFCPSIIPMSIFLQSGASMGLSGRWVAPSQNGTLKLVGRHSMWKGSQGFHSTQFHKHLGVNNVRLMKKTFEICERAKSYLQTFTYIGAW